MNSNRFDAVLESAAPSSILLKPDQQDRRAWIGKSLLGVVNDSPAGRHSAADNDNECTLAMV
jgi:hypothetical protein